MAKINNLPDFMNSSESESYNNENFDLNNEFKLTPCFSTFQLDNLTLEMCEKEAQRILNNLKNMTNEEIIENSNPMLVDNILSSFSTYRIEDLDYVPENEKKNIIEKLADLLKSSYFTHLKPEELFDAIQMQAKLSKAEALLDNEFEKNTEHLSDEEFEQLLNSPEFEHLLDNIEKGDFSIAERIGNILDNVSESDVIDKLMSLAETITDDLIEKGSTPEFLNAFIKNTDGSDVETFYNYQFNEAMENDPFVTTMYKIGKDFYGAHVLGKSCPNPTSLEVNVSLLPHILISVTSIDEETGNVVITFFDDDYELLDYEDMIAKFGVNFKKWTKKWKIEPVIDSFLLNYEHQNLLTKYKSDPISDFSQYANVHYYNKWFDEADELIDDEYELQVHNPNNNNSIINELELDGTKVLMPKYVSVVSNNKSSNIDLLTNPNYFGAIEYTEQNIEHFQNEILEKFQDLRDIFSVNVIIPNEVSSFPFSEELIQSYKLVEVYEKCAILEFKYNHKNVDPIYGALVKHKTKFTLFFPQYGNSFYINGSEIVFNNTPNIDFMKAHLDLILRTSKGKNQVHKLGFIRSFIGANTTSDYFKLGTLFFNESENAQKFRNVNNIKTNSVPIYAKINKHSGPGTLYNLNSFVFANNITESDLFKYANVHYNGEMAYVEVPLDNLEAYIRKYSLK